MSDELSFDASIHPAHVVVHPVVTGGERPFRRVDILGTQVGKAYNLTDVVEFIRRAGLDEGSVDDPGLVDWQDDGPQAWE